MLSDSDSSGQTSSVSIDIFAEEKKTPGFRKKWNSDFGKQLHVKIKSGINSSRLELELVNSCGLIGNQSREKKCDIKGRAAPSGIWPPQTRQLLIWQLWRVRFDKKRITDFRCQKIRPVKIHFPVSRCFIVICLPAACCKLPLWAQFVLSAQSTFRSAKKCGCEGGQL